MNIVIDNIDFWDGFQAAKYWSIPKSHSREQAKEEVKNCIMSGAYIGSVKRDGIWSMIIRDTEGNFHLRSRTENVNKTYNDKNLWIPHIINELGCIPNGTVLLGELYKKGDEGSRKATAILNCLKEKSLERQKTTPLTFYCFDVLAYKGKSLLNTPLEERINTYLNYELLDVLRGDYIEIAEYKEGEELYDTLGKTLADGYEGMVIQKKSALYLQGKRKAWDSIKCKKELSDTIDVFIDGAYRNPTIEYSGKLLDSWCYWQNLKTGEKYDYNRYDDYKDGAPIIPITKNHYYGRAAAVSISVMKDGKPYSIGYISGISDEMREGIVNTPEKYVGKVYEVNSMQVELIEDHYSLRHAKFVGPRPDKTKEDCGWDQIEREAK